MYKKRKEEVEIVNQADNLAYTTERLFKDLEGKVPEKEIGEIKGKILELKELLKEKNVDAIRKKMDEVNELVQKMSTELYQKAGQQHKEPHKGHGTEEINEETEETKPKDENVVDADYEVKDESGKKHKKK